MEMLTNIIAGIFALFGAFILFFLLAVCLTALLIWIIWYRIKKRAHEVLRQEFGDLKNELDETIIDVEGKEGKSL